jgi:succinyl-diaminopimelate desuccinylase
MDTRVDKIFEKIEQLRDEAIALMKNLISINSVGPKNDGPGEAEKAKLLQKYLAQSGFKLIKNFAAPDPTVAAGERPNLVALTAEKMQAKTLWIMTHTDVVPAGDLSKWSSDPFAPEVKDDKIYGRGSEDNLQGLVSSVIMARAFIESGIDPQINIGLVMVADEETGSEFGLSYLLKKHSHLFKQDDLIIIPDAGEPDGSMIEVAEKSILWIKFKTVGQQVHASTPNLGINAFRAASHLVVRLEELKHKYNATDVVFEPPISTFEPTKKESNVPNINTLPGEDIFYFDCRILPQYDIEKVMHTVQQIVHQIEEEFKVKIEISTEQKEQAAPATSVDAPIVKLLNQAVKEVYEIEAKAHGIGGGTVAALFRRRGYAVAVWSTLDDLAHQPNEYCKISNMLNDAKVFAFCALRAS